MNKSRDVLPPRIRERIDAGDQSPEILELVDLIRQINEVVSQARATKEKGEEGRLAQRFAVLKSSFDFLLYDIGRYRARMKPLNNLNMEETP